MITIGAARTKFLAVGTTSIPGRRFGAGRGPTVAGRARLRADTRRGCATSSNIARRRDTGHRLNSRQALQTRGEQAPGYAVCSERRSGLRDGRAVAAGR
jgi:hypothetical protein